MERYERNGLCEYLKECDSPHEIRFYDTTKSLLVVARKKDNMPIMLIIDDRVSREEYGRELDFYEENLAKCAFGLPIKPRFPCFGSDTKTERFCEMRIRFLFWNQTETILLCPFVWENCQGYSPGTEFLLIWKIEPRKEKE